MYTNKTGHKLIAAAGLDSILTLKPQRGEIIKLKTVIITCNLSEAALCQIRIYSSLSEFAISGITNTLQTTNGVQGWNWSGELYLRYGERAVLEILTNEANDNCNAFASMEIVNDA